MAKITYVPAEGESAKVRWGRYDFEANKAVEVNDPGIIAKARDNPQFKVTAAKEETRQAEVVGGYTDANTGQPVELVRAPRAPVYGGGSGGPTGPTPPSAATQGSTATQAAAPRTTTDSGEFEKVFGASVEEFRTGEYEGAPEYVGPEGTEGASAKPAGRKAKK